jgi:hypothetical protein
VVLGLGVLQHLLGLAGAAQRVQRALCSGDRLAGDRREARGRVGEHVRPGSARPGLGLAAELLDAALDQTRVVLRLLEVVLKALSVRRLRRHGDVSLE